MREHAFFRGTTWKEFKMLSVNNSVFQDAGAIMYEVSEDKHMREILEAREDARRNENVLLDYMQERIDETAVAQNTTEKERAETAAKLDDTTAKLDAAYELLRKQRRIRFILTNSEFL